MALARTAGRKGRPTRRVFAKVRAESDICILCGHPGARDVNHNTALSVDRSQALNPANLAVIHGVTSPCPVCIKWSDRKRRLVPRVCNSELGARHPSTQFINNEHGTRDW